jgi:hypothetical protein
MPSFFDVLIEAKDNVMKAIPAETFSITGELDNGATTGGYRNASGNYIRRSHGQAFMPHDEYKWFGNKRRYYRPAYYYPWVYPTYSYPYHQPYYNAYPTHKVIKNDRQVVHPTPKVYIQPGMGMNILVILGIVLAVKMIMTRK